MDEDARIEHLHRQLTRLRRGNLLLLHLLEESLDERRALQDALERATRLRVER